MEHNEQMPQRSSEKCERKLCGELQLPFNHSYLHGEIFPPFITQQHLDDCASIKLRDSDTFISTFPKNGTTWTQKVVLSIHSIQNTGHLQDQNKHLQQLIPWFEDRNHTSIEEIENMPTPRYFKTHNPYRMVAHNPEVPCRYIYVSRNPKDVCVSLFHHCRAYNGFGYDGDFEEFCNLFLQGMVESGDWWTHVRDYYTNSNKLNILFLKYEDMHTDGISAVKQINDFCGLAPLADDKALEVLELSAFNKMKDDPKSNFSWLKKVRQKDHQPFMRKGTVGDWQNYFSPEMAKKFNDKTRNTFSGIDLTFSDTM